jgi:hypothetical protein
LAERFARGEIDKVEFEEKWQIIAGLREVTPPTAVQRTAAVDIDKTSRRA